jgi:hypothetical protein
MLGTLIDELWLSFGYQDLTCAEFSTLERCVHEAMNSAHFLHDSNTA